MHYDQALGYLKDRELLGIKFGLENINCLASALGHPERIYPSILIAGTNGKGSTAAILESILHAAGYRTGLFTSPHFRCLEERILVDGTTIGRTDLADVVSLVAQVVDVLVSKGELSQELTFFETLTMCAFELFRRQAVDVAVLEVGMGGRLDATNIAPASVSVITPVGLDHEQFLGKTVSSIAAEKAAIVKAQQPVVVGDLVPEALAVVRKEANRGGSPLYVVPEETRCRSEETLDGQTVWVETPERIYDELQLPLSGSFQVDNLALSLRVAEVASRHIPTFVREIGPQAVARGVAGTCWKGRLEMLKGEPSLLLDAAHNEMAAAHLAKYLDEHRVYGRVLLFGVMQDKHADRMLKHLLPHVEYVIATRTSSRRAREPESIAALAKRRGKNSEAIVLPGDALKRACQLAGTRGQVVVAGSIYLLGEIKNLLAGVPASTGVG